MLIRRFIVCLLFFTPVLSFAQERGKVEVVKDPRIDSLIGGWLDAKKTSNHTGVASSYGFRVQIFSGSNRKEAYNAQAKFQEKYPEMRTYIIYREPNFKVRAGDFRTHMEAEKMMQELRPWFTSMFIISEKINLPKLDTPND